MQKAINSKSEAVERIVTTFAERYGGSPSLFRAPGRVNLIGEHTDYNDGFVMPAALNFYSYVAIAPRSDRELHIYSANFDESRVLRLDSLSGAPSAHWSDYIRGVTAVLRASGKELGGANIVIDSQVPIGAGLSSSAALEVSTAIALLENSGLEMPREQIAKACQRAENEFTGAMCGIMDQFISCFGRDKHALLIDCRSLSHELLPISDEVKIVICNTKVKHNLAGGEYNQRRASCEASVRRLQKFLPEIKALRDVTLSQLDDFKGELSEVELRRARHVISENQRVIDAADALKSGDLNRFGELMYESHRSLRDDYEVSCKELDLMVELAAGADGVVGARMTGGGFGGCTVNLVRAARVEDFARTIREGYREACGLNAEVYVCEASEGASQIS